MNRAVPHACSPGEAFLNLILLFSGDFISTTRVRLQGRRLKHVCDVHRAKAGDELIVGLEQGRMGSGRVISIDSSGLEMDVLLDLDPPAPLPLTLILALPRPKVLRRVIRSVTALGVKRLVLLNAFRVEKSYWASPVLEPGSLRQEMVAGLEQARDTVLPEVLLRPLFKPFAEDELPGLSTAGLRLVAHPGGSAPCPRAVAGPVILAIGPEGGFIPFEIELFRTAGFSVVECGERILHVEAAVPALLGRLF